MARERDQARQATEALAEIESVFDRAAHWTAQNPGPVLAALAAILLTAAGLGTARYLGQRSSEAASEAVAEIQQSYFEAMGAPPGSVDVVEPANPETARTVRLEHAERFLEAAEAHEGTADAVTAQLEAAGLLEAVGEDERALEVWRESSRSAPKGSVLRALALERYAVALERKGAFEEAAVAHEEAGGIEAFPGRWLALANAARTWAEAGQPARALALFDRLEEEAPGDAVPSHVAARMRTLRAAQGR